LVNGNWVIEGDIVPSTAPTCRTGRVRARALGLKSDVPAADQTTMLALLAIPPLAAAILLWRANRAIRAGVRAAAEADPVTGLPGRTRFQADFDARVAGRAPTTLLLARLDGFAAYDAAFGHRAGDGLLVRLGGELLRAVRDEATAYRTSGTTFCVLAGEDVMSVDALERRVSAALRERGTGFAVATSVGRVVLPRDATSAGGALRLADARADLARRAADPKPRDASPTAALADALALAGDHALGAAELAEAVAKRMGMSALERAHVRLASQLSGLGKLAIPDTLLGKAGHLSDAERAYIRNHPVIGERILLRARGLEEVAALVRSSRERYDGTGHPDGLAAEAIPLGARIVAVCDAFDAMLSQRPWRPAMGTDAAIAELHAGAGSQFDGVVVDAFAAVIDERSRLPA
jgi:diguanylate cyclase (GGDEF)-like protein